MTVILTSGEPAGIGPDIILKAALSPLDAVVTGDFEMFRTRAALLNLPIECVEYGGEPLKVRAGTLHILHEPLKVPAVPGQLNPENSAYVIKQLDRAIDGCVNKRFSAMVTAPVHKAVINQAGITFTGHTEYLAKATQTEKVVMMLTCPAMRVALVTTHIPLAKVASQITVNTVQHTITQVLRALKKGYGIHAPKVMVAGLNPHAGESGYLGREEIDVIEPALDLFSKEQVLGPVSADTMFSQANCLAVDAFIAMYHDQGLAPLKYAAFGQAANVTLGLPITRTSVDHGTALPLAGTGSASESSLLYAIAEAQKLGAVN